MTCIAVIGGDGAGKTTVTRWLLASGRAPYRYLYMGINVGSSNAALPTSRLLARLRGRRDAAGSLHAAGPRTPRRGWKAELRAFARLAYRLSEEVYRQLLCWAYELRGEIVLCDRHFVYDFYEQAPARRAKPLADRIHLWLLERGYPRPDLVIFLDAPAEVLFARKGEATLAFLEGRRAAVLELGARDPRFCRVDATRPLAEVQAEVARRIEPLLAARGAASRTEPGAAGSPRA